MDRSLAAPKFDGLPALKSAGDTAPSSEHDEPDVARLLAVELRAHRDELRQLLLEWQGRCEASFEQLGTVVRTPREAVKAPGGWAAEGGDASDAGVDRHPSVGDSSDCDVVRRRSRVSSVMDVQQDRELMKRWEILDTSEKARARASAADPAPLESTKPMAPPARKQRGGIPCVQRIVNRPGFEWTAAVTIIANAIFVGVQVEVAATSLQRNQSTILEIGHLLFCIVYTVELVLRILSDGPIAFFTGWTTFNRRNVGHGLLWNLFDVFIVVAALVEVIISYIFEDVDLTVLLVARILRIVRIIRIIRNIEFFRDLRLMVYSVFHTLKSLIWSFVLIFIVMYLVAIVLTAATTNYMVRTLLDADPEVCQHGMDGTWSEPWCELHFYFGGLEVTLGTLFESISGGVSWGERCRLLVPVGAVNIALFYGFIFFTVFAMLNVITGFFCEKAVEMANHDRDAAVQEQLRNKTKYVEEMKYLFEELDSDGSGLISFKELEGALDNEKVQAYFALLQLDIGAAWDIFRLLDQDESHSVSVDEFALGCLRLRGIARTVDVATIQFEMEKMMGKMSLFFAFVESQFQTVHARTSEMHPVIRQPSPETSLL